MADNAQQQNGYDHSFNVALLSRAHARIDDHAQEIKKLEIEQAKHGVHLDHTKEISLQALVKMSELNGKLDVMQNEFSAKLDNIQVHVNNKVETLSAKVQQATGAARFVEWLGPKGIMAALAIAVGGAAVGTKIIGG